MKVVFPRKTDTRIYIFLFFILLSFIIVNSEGFARTWTHFFISLSVFVVTDLALATRSEKLFIFPLSGIVSSFGIAVLLDSPVYWPIVLAAAFSSASKHLIRANGRHIFNPNNFGIVVTSLAFPDWVATSAYRWQGKFELTLLLFFIGLIISFKASRFFASISYMIFFLFLNLLRAAFSSQDLFFYSYSLVGPAMQLFIFFMVSDPKTTPESKKHQIALGFGLASIDTLFRHFHLKDAPLYALFLTCLIFGAVDHFTNRRKQQLPSWP